MVLQGIVRFHDGSTLLGFTRFHYGSGMLFEVLRWFHDDFIRHCEALVL